MRCYTVTFHGTCLKVQAQASSLRHTRQYWDRIWGATPIEDLPKYKDLYTFTSYIKAAIDVTVNLAISNGFELNGGDDTVREWLSDWLDEQNILQTLRIVASDMLVFGNAFIEICRDETSGEVSLA